MILVICKEKVDKLTENQTYRVVTHDDRSYWILNDDAILTKYPKQYFISSESKGRVIQETNIDMPNDSKYKLHVNDIVDIEGVYSKMIDNMKQDMLIVSVSDKKVSISIPKNILEIFENRY
jgi:hypothetical protein